MLDSTCGICHARLGERDTFWCDGCGRAVCFEHANDVRWGDDETERRTYCDECWELEHSEGRL